MSTRKLLKLQDLVKGQAYTISHHYKLREVPKYAKILKYFNYARYVNFGIVKHLPKVIRNPKLLIPNEHRRNVDKVDFERLAQRGIKGIIFDKDNTLTYPHDYELRVCGVRAIDYARDEFPKTNIAILSNSYGYLRYNWLPEYDIPELCYLFPCDWFALSLHEKMVLVQQRVALRQQWRETSRTGRKVRLYYDTQIIIHSKPKPDCIADVMAHFKDVSDTPKIKANEIAVIGDRILTDVLFGNLNGMYTILVTPVDHQKDIWIVKKARIFEHWLYDWLITQKERKLKQKEEMVIKNFEREMARQQVFRPFRIALFRLRKFFLRQALHKKDPSQEESVYEIYKKKNSIDFDKDYYIESLKFEDYPARPKKQGKFNSSRLELYH